MLRWSVFVVALLFAPALAVAKPHRKPAAPVEPAPVVEPAPAEAAEEDAPEDPMMARPHRTGPALVELGDGVEIDLPAGFVLLERAAAAAYLEENGENTEGVLGIVTAPGAPWAVFIDFADVGHVSDADANQLDAGTLFASMLQGNAAQNRVRVAKGVSEFFLDDWSQRPGYDASTRVLSWGTRGHVASTTILNQFTNVLGRHGFVGIDLNTPADELEASAREAAPVMAGVRFQAGHRYEDFRPGVDKDSGMGLRNLIVGGSVAAAAASKVGLFAKIALVLKKVAIAVAAAFAAAFKWLKGKFSRRRDGDDATA